MSELYPYPRFSLAERDRRWKTVRELMLRQNIDVIVTPQNTGHSTDFQANTRYLTHVGGGGDSDIAAVFPLEGEVTAIATSAAPRWPTVQDWTQDVREARRNYGRVIVERLKELNVERGRIGITGLGQVEGTRTPEGTILYGTWKQIREAFPHAELVDATAILAEVRYVKSQEEIEVLTKSMEMIELAYQAEVEAARSGVKDWEVWAATQYALMRNGSEMPVHCNWVSGKNSRRTLSRPSMRILERGDLIINEVEASWIGYRAQGVQPVFVEVADPIHKELIKVQREIFNRVMENLKPGITVAELAELTRRSGESAAPKSGPAAGAKAELTMHGRGAGDDGPIITSHARSPRQLGVALRENMVFICKPSANTGDGQTICTWGDTVIVTSNGGWRLGKRSHDLAVSGS
ncbi:MAG TPA: M24 family metallopeptidase [Candidatus Binatia bacterium]|jgi:Xaa-Pro aminopeptidase|nr:M24 family metallopeptidase [Candidatus Binatia bacterium]